MLVVYYSHPTSNNTHRFVEKLGSASLRLPSKKSDGVPEVTEPFVLITPTYGAGHDAGTVPAPVVRFLNNPANRSLIRGVVGAGNANFGASYAKAGKIVAEKCKVPLIHTFEILGMDPDVSAVQHALTQEQL